MSLAALQFRDARPGDEPAIRKVVATVLAEFGLSLDETTDADLENVIKSYVQPGGVFRVLETGDGRIVGCGGLCVLNEHEIELRKMYFLPEARGLGLGRMLLADLIAYARAKGFQKIVLETASMLRTAQLMYQRAGFVEVPRAHLASRCDKAFELPLQFH